MMVGGVKVLTCAVLWKSPNCASQHTSTFGELMEKPSSNPSTANSLKELLQTVYLAWSGDMLDRKLL